MAATLRQSAFLFDYQAFLREVTPLLTALDAGDSGPLYTQVIKIRRQVGLSENWVLHDVGSALGDFGLDRNIRYRNALWGHWLLIVLSTFLRPCVSLDKDFDDLGFALRQIGWDDKYVERLNAGLPTPWLVKPEIPYQRGMTLEWDLPYWYHIGAQRSSLEGWLPLEEAARLLERLLKDRSLVTSIQTRAKPPSVSPELRRFTDRFESERWYPRLIAAYDRAVRMMMQSVESGLGLYLIVYEPESASEDDKVEAGNVTGNGQF